MWYDLRLKGSLYTISCYELQWRFYNMPPGLIYVCASVHRYPDGAIIALMTIG